MVLPLIFKRAFGISFVSGMSREPIPAESIIAFISGNFYL
jgi:hypothetical protein